MIGVLASLFLAWQVGAVSPGVGGHSKNLPSAEVILDRYVQVTGGKERYRQFSFLTVDASVTPEHGTTFYTTTFRARDGRTETVVDDEANPRQSGVGSGVVWEFSKNGGARVVSGTAAARALADAHGFTDADWRERFPGVKTVGEQSVRGRRCYAVELTRMDGSTLKRFYDEESGLLVREVSTEFDAAGVEGPVETDAGDYTTSLPSLLQYPSVLHVKRASGSFVVHINSVFFSNVPAQEAFVLPREVVRAVAGSRRNGDLPNAMDLIDKYVQATGGREAYKNAKSEFEKAELWFPEDNLKVPLSVYVADEKTYAAFEVPTMGKFEVGSDGTVAWERSVVMGPSLLRRGSFGHLIGPGAADVSRWTDGGLDIQTVGKSEVAGSPCYVVNMGDGPTAETSSTACFAISTGYLVRVVPAAASQGGGEGVQSLFSDYRPVGGFVAPYHIETKMAGKRVVITVQELSIDAVVPPGVFDLPPDVRALLGKKKAGAQGAEGGENGDRPTLMHGAPRR